VNITNWYRNNRSDLLLYLPFEGSSNSTYTKDYSGHGNDGIVSGAIWDIGYGVVGGAYSFDGDTDSISVRKPDLLNFSDGEDFSISFWLEPGNSDYDLISNRNISGAGYIIEYNVFPYSQVVFSLNDGVDQFSIFTTDISAEVFHVAVVFDEDDEDATTIYINGIDSKNSISGTLSSIGNLQANPFNIPMLKSFGEDHIIIDELKIFNMSLSSEQVLNEYLAGLAGISNSRMAFSMLSKDDSWHCEVTPNDGYQDGNTLNSSAVTIQNAAPQVINVSFAPDTPLTTVDLSCNATAIDLENSTVTVEYYWYNNSVLWSRGNKTGVQNGTSTVIDTLDSSILGSGQEWNCTVRAFDGVNYSAYASAVVSFTNVPPSKVILESPTQGNTTIWTNPPRFTWLAATDDDGDPLNYTINITSQSCPDYGISTNITDLNFTPASELCMEDMIFWQVRAWDGKEFGEWSDRWNFTIEPVLILTLVQDEVSFGLMELNETKDTDTGYLPMTVRNDGNIIANITWLSANHSLWQSVGSNTDYFQFKIDNATTEAYSFDWSASQTSWVNVTLISEQNSTAVAYLNYSDSNDEAEIDIRVTVPPFEPPGNRSTLIYVIGQDA